MGVLPTLTATNRWGRIIIIVISKMFLATQVLLVAGGYSFAGGKVTTVATTEIYKDSAGEWKKSANFLDEVGTLSGATLDNTVYMFGECIL